MPFSASTVRPESSETAGRPVCAAIARALSSALSANVLPGLRHVGRVGELVKADELAVERRHRPGCG